MAEQLVNPVEVEEVKATPPVPSVIGEIKPEGMEMTLLREGKRRYVHVIRNAIRFNAKREDNYWATVMVQEEDGKRHWFHAVLLHGQSALKFETSQNTEVSANVYLVTYGKIMGYLDPSGKKSPHGCEAYS